MDNDKLVSITYSHLQWSAWYDSINLEELSIEEYSHHTTLEKSIYYLMDYDDDSLYMTQFQKNKTNYTVKISLNEEMDEGQNKKFKTFIEDNLKIKNISDLKYLKNTLLNATEVASKEIPLDSFNTTENSLLYYLKHENIKNIKYLSLAEVNIADIKIQDLGIEELQIEDKSFIVHHIKIIYDEDQPPTDLWINEENQKLPYILRIKGKDETGEYELILNF